jgi:membrane peptidoglycan carboxypeptidase
MLYNSDMSSVPYLIQKRQRRRQARRQNSASRTGLLLSVLFSVSLAAGVIASSFGYTFLIKDLPSLEALPALLEPPNGILLQPTRLYDRSGQTLIYTLENPASSGKNYLYVSSRISKSSVKDELGEEAAAFSEPAPDDLIASILAVQDPTFWEHNGYLLQGLRQGEHRTLAQRLVVDLLLWEEPPGLVRDLRERLLAAQITGHYGRARIIEWYLNSASFGPKIIGADAAARAYFDKPAAELNLAESALLAAVAESPSLNPFTAAEIVRERQQQVLSTMLTQGVINHEEMQEALLTPLEFNAPVEPPYEPAPAFTRMVLDQLEQRFGSRWLERGGLNIITSLDHDLQTQINCTSNEELNRLQSGVTTQLPPSEKECSAALLLPTMPISAGLSRRELAANVIVFNPESGQVLALSGGTYPGLDPTRLPGHSPGTLLTPFIYLTAFTRGFSPASLVWDIPSNLPGLEITAQDENVYRGPIRLRTAFANDYLIPAVQVINQIGPENVWQTAQQMGITSLLQSWPSNYESGQRFFQGSETTLLEMVQAFGVFANLGASTGLVDLYSPAPSQALLPVLVLEVSDHTGKTWLNCRESIIQCPMQARPVVSPQLAYLIIHMLSDEVARWPSLGHPNPLEIGRPAAVKIGRTLDSQGSWTIGFTPQLVTGVWVGPASRDPQSIPITPAEDKAVLSAAAGLWHAVIQYATRELPPLGWTLPGGIKQVEVCEPSGLLPTLYCPTTVSEVFLEGNEPIYTDNLYRPFCCKPGDWSPGNRLHAARPGRGAGISCSSALGIRLGCKGRPACSPFRLRLDLCPSSCFKFCTHQQPDIIFSRRRGGAHRGYCDWEWFFFLPAAGWRGIEST